MKVLYEKLRTMLVLFIVSKFGDWTSHSQTETKNLGRCIGVNRVAAAPSDSSKKEWLASGRQKKRQHIFKSQQVERGDPSGCSYYQCK